MIIKSNHSKIFGGFTDTAWASSGGYKFSKDAFLFSIDRKEKYNVNAEDKALAVFHSGHFGPTFGGGFDIYTIATQKARILISLIAIFARKMM